MTTSNPLKKPGGWLAAAAIVNVALIAGTIAFYTILRERPNSLVSKATPTSNNHRLESVAALGYIEPEGEMIKVSAPAFKEGTRVAQLLVKLGERVKTGQTIAILDNRDRLQAALKEARAAEIVARSRLAQVEAGAKQGDIAAGKARFQQTQAELEGQINTQRAMIASLEDQREGDMSSQEAVIQRIQAEQANANLDCRRYRTLYEQGAVAQQQRDQFCLQAEVAGKNLLEAQATLKRITTSQNQKIQEARANLERTKLTLNRQIEENRSTLEAVREVRPVDVGVARAELISASASVERAEADLALAYVKAPRDGQILKIHTRAGELVGSDGIVDLGETDQMYVRAEIYETDIFRIRTGQKAIIKASDRLGPLEGTVDEIGLQVGRKNTLGTDPVADADARVVEVKIRLTPEASRKVSALTNLEVNVKINTSDKKGDT